MFSRNTTINFDLNLNYIQINWQQQFQLARGSLNNFLYIFWSMFVIDRLGKELKNQFEFNFYFYIYLLIRSRWPRDICVPSMYATK